MPRYDFAEQLRQFGPNARRRAPLAAEEASRYCRRLARSHYENFAVASLLLPAALRPHFFHVYAYCRWADDLGDEVDSPQRALQLLDWWEHELNECYAGHAWHPVFVALSETIRQFQIPRQPLADLLVAFRQDQQVTRYATAQDVLDYCRYSANPVGRIVLCLGGCLDDRRAALSDAVCTGLQLANFCQDVALDYRRGRIYLPQEVCRRQGYGEDDFARRTYDQRFRRLLQEEVQRAEAWLRRGLPLAAEVPRWLGRDVWIMTQGGLALLQRIRDVQYDVWTRRPRVSKAAQVRLLLRSLWAPRASQGAEP